MKISIEEGKKEQAHTRECYIRGSDDCTRQQMLS